MRRLLREPFLHFALMGGLLFLLYSTVSKKPAQRADEIVLDAQQLAALIHEHTRVLQRQPTPDELSRSVDSWVREEVLYREGLAAGLERGDNVVRRRVVQKMTFLAESMSAAPPTDAELHTWFGKHAGDYQLESAYSLRQVYFDPTRHGADLGAVIARAQSALRADPQAEVGDRTLLPLELEHSSASEVERIFGKQFLTGVAALPHGSWEQVDSSFGRHLVRLDAHAPARTPKLDEVRAAVERDFARARTEQSVEDFYRRARARYQVRIAEKPGGAGAPIAAGEDTSKDDT